MDDDDHWGDDDLYSHVIKNEPPKKNMWDDEDLPDEEDGVKDCWEDEDPVPEPKRSGANEKTLDTFIPQSENDFLEYAQLISHKLRPYQKSYHYLGLLQAVMRLAMADLKAQDAKEVASSVTTIANQKLKDEEEKELANAAGQKKFKSLFL